MKRIFHIFAAIVATTVAVSSCNKDESKAVLELKSVTATEFTSDGGLGTALFECGGAVLNATSSAPDWLRVSVANSAVLFSVFSHTGDSPRSAVITVSAEGVPSVDITVNQSAFKGIVVSSESLSFSDTERSSLALVHCTCDYEVAIRENPDNIFSFAKGESGVTFSVSRSQGRKSYTGRAVITPSDKSIEPVYITLNLARKSDWYYLLGTWKVAKNTDATADRSDFIFSSQSPLESFEVAIQKDELVSRPFTAEFVDGKVRIGIQGFSIDSEANRYYSIHYNGCTVTNPSAWYIFSAAGAAAWDAEPVFDENSRTVTLSFSTANLGNGNVPKQLNIWWSTGRYFGFTSKIVSYTDLVLTKEYTE